MILIYQRNTFHPLVKDKLSIINFNLILLPRPKSMLEEIAYSKWLAIYALHLRIQLGTKLKLEIQGTTVTLERQSWMAIILNSTMIPAIT